MKCLEIVFNSVDSILTLINLILIAKYVYYEKISLDKVKWGIFAVFYIILELILFSYELDDISILACISCFSVVVAMSRKKRRIRAVFLCFPVMGILGSLFTVVLTVFVIINKSSYSYMIENSFVSFWVTFVCFVLLVLYIRYQKHWKQKYFGDVEFENFELKRGERALVSFNGFVLLILFCFFSLVEDESEFDAYRYEIIACCIFVSVIILVTSLNMVRKAVSTGYYKSLSQINEHYLQAQLNHFQTYRKAQIETRRIRHDMKNHLLCMCELYNNKDFETLGDYLYDLSNAVININKELFIGNDIADAIINEKNEIAKSLGIEINTEGTLSGVENIAPIDMCTIFANALDNCIEALKGLKLDKLVIKISAKKNRNFLLISFINPVEEEVIINEGKSIETRKLDKDNHGFGIKNIRLAAQKYGGDINASIVNDIDFGKAFRLEVMLNI